MPLGGIGEKGSGEGERKQGEISICKYQETVWIEVHVDMQLQIGFGHDWGGIKVFVYYWTDQHSCKRNWGDLVKTSTSRSEFMTI